MYFQEVAIGWTPGGDVDVIGINELERSERFNRHPMKTSPAYRNDLIGISGVSAKLAILVHFHMLVVRDKVDPVKVHNAFMDINKYRDTIVADALPRDVPRWATPSRKRMPPNLRHGVRPKRTTADLLAWHIDKAKADRAKKDAA
jgi:hypothetical protein